MEGWSQFIIEIVEDYIKENKTNINAFEIIVYDKLKEVHDIILEKTTHEPLIFYCNHQHVQDLIKYYADKGLKINKDRLKTGVHGLIFKRI